MNILGISIAAVIGLITSLYLLYSRKKKVSLMCPRKGCDAVVGSRYGVTLGIHNDVLGTLYYSLWLLLCLLVWQGGSVPAQVLLIYATLGAFMSVRLLSIQAFVLRAWCLWCLVSAAVSFAIVLFL